MTKDTIWYVKGYLVYKDRSGIEHTVYSDCVKANIYGEVPDDVSIRKMSVPRGLQYVYYGTDVYLDDKVFTPVILGLETLSDMTYTIHNGNEWYSQLFFASGNVENTGRMIMHYSEPSFKSVIMGDFDCGSSEFCVSVDYDPADLPSDFSQKDVPYFYVDGQLSGDNIIRLGSYYNNQTKAPFNVFLGSIDINQGNGGNISGDLYLMDYGAENTIVSMTADFCVKKWKNDMSTSDEHFQSGGGNIYCNGDLTLSAGTIEGDVRVSGKLTIDLSRGTELRIYGDIACEQLEIIGDANRMLLGGTVYCDYLTGQFPYSAAQRYYLSDYLMIHPEGVYPDPMTRANILGIDEHSGEIIPEAAETKFIVYFEDLRNEAGYDHTTGEFADFYTCYPNGIPEQTPSNTFGQNWANGTTDAVYIPSDADLSGDIEITPTCPDFWIILGDDGRRMAPNRQFNLIIDDSVYNVNVLIRGEVQLDLNSAIISKSLFERKIDRASISCIDQNTDRININIYASGDIFNGCDSLLTLKNDSIITGNAIAPNLEINCSGIGWRVYELITKNGETITNVNSVDWIGNGLFRSYSPYDSSGGSYYGWLSMLQLDPAETSLTGYLS